MRNEAAGPVGETQVGAILRAIAVDEAGWRARGELHEDGEVRERGGAGVAGDRNRNAPVESRSVELDGARGGGEERGENEEEGEAFHGPDGRAGKGYPCVERMILGEERKREPKKGRPFVVVGRDYQTRRERVKRARAVGRRLRGGADLR